MRTIQLAELHQPLQLVETTVPIAGPGEVLINLRAAAINHRDVFIQRGLYPGIKLPIILGSDGAGIVDDVGEGVDPMWRGQSVVINPSLYWGDNPAYYGNSFQILGMPTNGTFAQYIALPVAYIHHKPDHLSYEQAAALPLAGLTAWRALMTRAGLQTRPNAPEKVLITGIGGGAALFALQFALAAGAEVWVTSGSEEKLDRARKMGAVGSVNYRHADWHKALIAQTGGGRSGYFDVIIDSAGGPDFTKLIDLAAAGGRIVFFGGTAGNITDVSPAKVFFKQLSIYGTTMGTSNEFTHMLDQVANKQIVPIIDEVFFLADAQKGFERMNQGAQFGKIVLAID